MARSGISRVKTGCVTCKIRRIKCDEARPACRRCVTTGRACDGYSTPSTASYSWAQLLRSSPTPSPAATHAAGELRALGFFREVVAPVLAGPLDGFFWTHLVIQFTHQEQAARHAVLAISSLYENFQQGFARSPLIEKDAFAVKHYNEAIRHLRTTNSQEAVLLVCILFTCIDMLRGDCEGAVSHCRHGINMVAGNRADSSVVCDQLLPTFYRMAIFPFFFGARPESFPEITTRQPHKPTTFWTIAEAQFSLDPLVLQVIRFVRSSDEYRLGQWTNDEPGMTTLRERVRLDTALDEWAKAFHTYQGQKSPQHDPNDMRTQIVERLLGMKWFVAKIWIDTCLSRGEMVYDLHLDKFRAIIELARQAEVRRQALRNVRASPKFTFEMGFGPLLAFVVIKCRSLRLRVAALSLMKTLAYGRESLWENGTMIASGARTIEVEHGLQGGLDINQEAYSDDEALPAEEQRIQDSITLNEEQTVTSHDGGIVLQQRVAYLMRRPGESITVRDEWYSVAA
ncbi:hypothetical protein VD0002_g8339 [Verticillium dahliae]|uniref:Zn(2)-C6 fungal-type domain-containing protein n=2 Tax=Verticillium dahliae TaxID=27337 RepID=G2X6R0_VERDV|nr:uncharacterized protein VDAG_05842 [Verticillium dahliae VdLs.17]KAF3345849.1 Expansin-yoaJ [Verticillium dahliae VDG2]KAH6708268.1 hypothetical protein EV126DRAFT_408531 [Verticillium dahliae]EGY14678.1 hypothetical protein VDAG_05842 [Verticillium dahliae VdLs.17]PNH35128.1 hypothetical protein BJF96_g1726 [Verticillium dahliae]PNH38041.1 hypothetical protein VD0004_g8764 [Verticillium dahliae]